MSAPDRARVFFALWPDDAVRGALADAAARAHAECGGKLTPAPKIHLTLFFVGDLARSRVAALSACANTVAAASFELEPAELGYWRHNRIVWAGMRETPAALRALVADLTAALAREGCRADDRPYVPHVTLIRNARRPPQSKALQSPSWRADAFVLAESAGGRYDVLERWPLARPL